MSQQLQLRRGTEAQIQTFTGAQGEVTPATDTMRLHTHDGATSGGWAHALETRIAVADANYTAKVTDRIVAYTSITAPRTVTLPSAASYPSGAVLRVIDESGLVSPSLSITIARAGSDVISGLNSLAITSPYKCMSFESNGVSTWSLISTTLPLVQIEGAAVIRNLNINTLGDVIIPFFLPPGVIRYRVNNIFVSNSQGALPTVARVGVYTGASQTGAAVAAQQALGLTSQADATSGNTISLTLATPTTISYTSNPLYFNVGTVQGATASVDVTIYVQLL